MGHMISDNTILMDSSVANGRANVWLLEHNIQFITVLFKTIYIQTIKLYGNNSIFLLPYFRK